MPRSLVPHAASPWARIRTRSIERRSRRTTDSSGPGRRTALRISKIAQHWRLRRSRAIEGRGSDAIGLYQQAIRSAYANGFIHNEAIAYEVAARFYAARDFDKIADAYFLEARNGYLRWGADGKVRQLDQQYPQLRQEKPAVSSASTIAAPVEHLDLATVIEVSQVVSGEIVLEKG